MITKFKKYLIKESPDHIYDGDTRYYCMDEDAIPFFVNVNSDHTKLENIFFGDHNDYHSDIKYSGSRYERAYPGRIWTKGKIMTFWVYPNEKLFSEIIKAIENKFNIKMFNNGWRIEIIKSGDDIKRKKYDPSVSDYFLSDNYYSSTELIPIEKYAGSENVPEELQIIHLMNWQEKELAKKVGKFHFKGIGSDKTAWDSPHNIKYRQAIYQEKKNN